MPSGDGIARRVAPLIVASFTLIFAGPGVSQVFLRNLLWDDQTGAKATTLLAVLYGSFMFWRLGVVSTQRLLGDKVCFVLGVAGYLLVPAALALGASFPVLVVLSAVWGWAAAAIWLTGPVWLYDNTSSSRRGLWAGILYGFVFAAMWLGTILAGRRVQADDRMGALALLVAPGAVAVILAACLPARRARAEAPSISAAWRMISDRRVLVLGVMLFASAMTYGLLLGAFRNRIDDRYGPGTVATVLAYFFAARLALSVAGGYISDFVTRRGVVAAVFAAGGATLMAAAAGGGVTALSLAAAALGVVGGTIPVSANALAADWFPAEKRSLALGAAFFWNDAGTAVSLLAGLAITTATADFATPMLLFGALFVVLAGASALFLKDAGRGGGDAPDAH